MFALLGADPLRDRRRLLSAVAVTAVFLGRLPWWGISWLSQPWPELPGRVLQNADVIGGLLALLLLWWVSRPGDGVAADRSAQKTPTTSRAV